jgi:hypothetical protein
MLAVLIDACIVLCFTTTSKRVSVFSAFLCFKMRSNEAVIILYRAYDQAVEMM